MEHKNIFVPWQTQWAPGSMKTEKYKKPTFISVMTWQADVFYGFLIYFVMLKFCVICHVNITSYSEVMIGFYIYVGFTGNPEYPSHILIKNTKTKIETIDGMIVSWLLYRTGLNALTDIYWCYHSFAKKSHHFIVGDQKFVDFIGLTNISWTFKGNFLTSTEN